MFSSNDDRIDSRDIIVRTEELTSLIEAIIEDNPPGFECDPANTNDLDELLGHYHEQRQLDATRADLLSDAESEADAAIEDIEELITLIKLSDEGEHAPDWIHGEALIRDSHFPEYAQQTAQGSGMVEHGNQWPCSHIDWSEAADELKQDYLDVDFDGVTYWMRA